LGCEETDLLVRRVMARGPERGLYGAKITGGGSGGTVAVLAAESAEDEVRSVAEEYRSETGVGPEIFSESSPGALAFGQCCYELS
jgi:L-arabinokinase